MNENSFYDVAVVSLIGKILTLCFLVFLLTAKEPDLLDSFIKLIGGL